MKFLFFIGLCFIIALFYAGAAKGAASVKTWKTFIFVVVLAGIGVVAVLLRS